MLQVLRRLPRLSHRIALVASGTVLTLSCSTRQAGLELVVTTDLKASDDFDKVLLDISQQVDGGPHFHKDYLVPQEWKQPATFAIAAGSNANQEALINVTALKAGAPVVYREALVPVPRDRVAELGLFLAKACEGVTCPMGQGCDAQPDARVGLCVSNRVDPSTLHTYQPGDLDAAATAHTAAGSASSSGSSSSSGSGSGSATSGGGGSNGGSADTGVDAPLDSSVDSPAGSQLDAPPDGAACGGSGQACCSTASRCNANGCCDPMNSMCVDNAVACSVPGSVCAGGACQTCGASGFVCCAGSTCNGGGCCDANACVAQAAMCSNGTTCLGGSCGGDGGVVNLAIGLVALYLFDETSGTMAADVSGNGHAATMSGATFSSGLVGNAATMNGSNQHVILPTGIVNGLTSFSIAAWVKLSPTWSRVFDFGTGTNSYMFLTPPLGAGTRFGITTSGPNGEQLIQTNLPSTGAWQHVCVTLTGTVGTLYLDGVALLQNASMTLSPTSLGQTTQDWLGRSQFPQDQYSNGQIDNFRIYNRALAASEVMRLFQGKL